jgi:peptide/nickel transport system permease protein
MVEVEEQEQKAGGRFSVSYEKAYSMTRRARAWRTISPVFHRPSALIGIATLVAILLFVILGQFLTPYAPTHSFVGDPNSPPSSAHPFGTDFVGHDVFSQVVYGAFPTFAASLISAVISVLIGFFAGVFSGYYGKLEAIIGGGTDVFLTFPILPLIILFGELYVAKDITIALVLGILLWPPLARAVRAQVSSLKQRPYVEAARTSGVSDLRIVWTIMIPQVVFLAVAYLVINMAVSTVIVTAVEFLGVGDPNAINLGAILYWAQQDAFTAGAWWWFLAPGALIALFAVALSLIGFAMENILNPRLRG